MKLQQQFISCSAYTLQLFSRKTYYFGVTLYITDSSNYIGSVDEEGGEKDQHIETNESCGDNDEEDKMQPGIS